MQPQFVAPAPLNAPRPPPPLAASTTQPERAVAATKPGQRFHALLAQAHAVAALPATVEPAFGSVAARRVPAVAQTLAPGAPELETKTPEPSAGLSLPAKPSQALVEPIAPSLAAISGHPAKPAPEEPGIAKTKRTALKATLAPVASPPAAFAAGSAAPLPVLAAAAPLKPVAPVHTNKSEAVAAPENAVAAAPARASGAALIASPAPDYKEAAAPADTRVPGHTAPTLKPSEITAPAGTASAATPTGGSLVAVSGGSGPAAAAGSSIPALSAPPAAAPRPDADAPPPATQIGHAIANIHIAPGPGGTGGGQVTIHLQPAELGAVQISVARTHDGTAAVTVQVERADTLHALQADLAHLHQALDRAGLPAEQRIVTMHLAPASLSDSGVGAGGGGGSNRDAQQGAGNGGRQAARPQDVPPPADLGEGETTVWREAGINITA